MKVEVIWSTDTLGECVKLTHIRIKDLRSFFGQNEFEVSSGVNYFVGPNNCGKSNLIRALELALDPESKYDSGLDRPSSESGQGQPRTMRITLTFTVGKTSPENTLLRRAREYENKVRTRRNASHLPVTYAEERQIRMITSFGANGVRQTTFQAKGHGNASLPNDDPLHTRLEDQFRSVVRFGLIHSGEDIESLLRGKFREILQSVIEDHLGVELSKVEDARSNYLKSLQDQLLDPLRIKIQERVGGIFPEIKAAELIPDVPSVNETLSSVEILLGDRVTTGLTSKGTGVRGAVLISMLQYMAEQSKRSLVIAVEEPEAFLHPAGQEDIRSQLEDLAQRHDLTVLVTTHSPYVISRDSDSRVSMLDKSDDGRTRRIATSSGDEDRAELLGPLYRDIGMAGVIERSLSFPETAKVIVVTEGFTDGHFIKVVCAANKRTDLTESIHFVPAGSASKVIAQAIIADAATNLPVIALLDHDEQGRSAADKLKSMNWEPARRLLSLAKWPNSCGKHDIEMEDLLPPTALKKLMESFGEDRSVDASVRCSKGTHYSLSKEWKEFAITSLPAALTNGEAGGVIWLAEEIHSRANKIREQKIRARAAMGGTS